MQFHKYHGLGNDYIVIEPTNDESRLDEERIRAICAVHYGLGSDGILFGPLGSVPSDFPSACSAPPLYPVRIYNPDGSEAEKSGNGLRIFARHLFETGRVKRAEEFRLATLGGAARAIVEDPQGRIRVFIGKVSFRSTEVPMTGGDREVIDEDFTVGGRRFRCCAATVGNPHCILLVDAPSEELARDVGPAVECDPRFPNRTNVQFLTRISDHAVCIEIWERGAGYTLASGSSASACAAAACRLGLCASPVTVHMPGGTLDIHVDDDGNADLVGPVAAVARGEFADELLMSG